MSGWEPLGAPASVAFERRLLCLIVAFPMRTADAVTCYLFSLLFLLECMMVAVSKDDAVN